MNKDTSDAHQWESALGRTVYLGEKDWGRVFKRADPEAWAAYEHEEDATAEAMWRFEEACARHRVGSLGLDFPNSTHGDGVSVTVYVLPRGKTVMVRQASYAIPDPVAAVYNGARCNEMIRRAHTLLFDDRDYGIIRNADKNPEWDPDANTVYAGEAELTDAWTASIAERRSV